MVPTWFTKTCLLLPATCWKWNLRCMYSCCKSPCSWCAHSNCTARSLTRTAGSFLGRGRLFTNTQRAQVLRGSRSGERLWGTCCQGERWTWDWDAASIHHGFVCGLGFFFPQFQLSTKQDSVRWGGLDLQKYQKNHNKKAWARCTHNNTMSSVIPTMWGKKMPSATNWSVARPLSGQAARSKVMAWRHSLHVLAFSFAKLVLFSAKTPLAWCWAGNSYSGPTWGNYGH